MNQDQSTIPEIKNLQDVKSLIIMKCLDDVHFKERFLKDPKGAFEEAFGCELPEKFQLKAIQETETTKWIVLPYSHTDEMSEEELKAIAGGSLIMDLYKLSQDPERQKQIVNTVLSVLKVFK